MKILALVLFLFPAAVPAADFQAGLDAFNKGDFAAAMKEWQPLAEQGDANSQYNLGLLFARGQGTAQDYQKAMAWYRKAADQGVPAAEYNLGVMYANGQGAPANPQEALKWFLKASQQGVGDAETSLGAIYSEGDAAFRNYDEAAKWYRKAAAEGIASAAFSLGVMYDVGQGVPQSYAEALKWYQQSADAGYACAMTNIAILYYNGQGVKRDLLQAFTWFARAQKLGDPRAREMIGMAGEKLKPAQIKQVQAEVSAWQPSVKPAPVEVAKLFKPPADAPAPGPATAAPAAASDSAPAAASDSAPAAASTTATATAPATAPATASSAAIASASTTPAATAPAITRAAASTTAPAAASAITPAAASATTPAATAPATAPATASSATPASASTTPAATAPATTPAAASTTTPAAASTTAAATAPPTAPTAPATASGSAAATPSADPNQDEWNGVDRVIAIGDVHGDYEQFALVLQSAGLIDGNGNWTGGRTHLVQTGDILDRGPESRAVMDLLIRLEKQAAQAGGAVHCLIGNHEAMNMYGDLRYVTPAEIAAFGTGMREAFGPEGEYGKWLRGQNAIIKIDRTLFVHAGLGPKYADWSIGRINQEVHRELTDFTQLHGGIVTDQQGPLWFPDLAKGNEKDLSPLVDRLLKSFDVDRIVVGQSYGDDAVTPRFGGKVILVDVGISRVMGNNGTVACLEIDKNQPFALHRGQKLELPTDETGPDMLRYLKAAAALDPQPSPLTSQIEKLESK